VGGGEKYLTTGHERDTETDLDYRGARFYDSDVVRFLSLDPLAAKYANLSPYNYVAGNPVMLVDPTGREAKLSGTSAEDESPEEQERRKAEQTQDEQDRDPKPKPKKRPPPSPTNGNNGLLIMNAVKQFAYNYGLKPTYSLGVDVDFTLLFGSGWSADLNWLFVGNDASLFPYLTWSHRLNAATGINIGASAHVSQGYFNTSGYNKMPYEYAKMVRAGNVFNTLPPTSGSGAYAINYDVGEVANLNVGLAHSYLNNDYITNAHYINASAGVGAAGNLGLGPSVITGSGYTSGIVSHLSPFNLYNNLKSWWYGK
jgi:RHS repeat-associated protein